MQTLDAIYKQERRGQRFAAALKGVDLDAQTDTGTTFEDVRRRAVGDDPDLNDIVNLRGRDADREGFGIGAGLGYTNMDED